MRQIGAFAKPDPIESHFQNCMDLWVKLMRGELPTGGYSGLDSVCGRSASNYMAAEDDSEIVYSMHDWKLAETVNACVESLMPHERHAVYKAHGLSRVWPFKGLSETKSFELGMIALRRLIAKRC